MADRSYDVNINVNSPVMQNAMGAASAGGGMSAPMPPGVMQAHARAAQQLNEEIKRRIPPLDNLFKTMGIEVGIKSLLKQSQIFTSTVGSLFQMFGAMVDVILAPFVKYIVVGIQKFAEWIPKIGKFAELVERHVISPLIDFMRKVWDWMRYPGDWLFGIGPKKPKPGEQGRDIFSTQNISEAEGFFGKLKTAVQEGMNAVISVGVPIVWGIGALAAFVGAMALIRKVPEMAAWFAKSAINLLSSGPARIFGKKGFQMTGGFLGKESMETIGDMSMDDFQKKWVEQYGDAPPKSPIPAGELDQLNRIMKILNIDDINEITPTIFKQLSTDVQNTLIEISEKFTKEPFSEIPIEVGKGTSAIGRHWDDLFHGTGKGKGILAVVAAGIAVLGISINKLFGGGGGGVVDTHGVNQVQRSTDLLSGDMPSHLSRSAFKALRDNNLMQEFPTYDAYLKSKGISSAALTSQTYYEGGRTPSHVDEYLGSRSHSDTTAIVKKYTTSLDSTQIQLVKDAIADLRAPGGNTALAALLEAKLINPTGRIDDEILKGAITSYQTALSQGETFAAINAAAGEDLFVRLKGAWVMGKGNYWLEEMVKGGQYSLSDLGLGGFSGLGADDLASFRAGQSGALAFRGARALRGAMPIVGGGAAAIWQFSQWKAQQAKMRENARLESLEAGSYQGPGYSHNPLDDFPDFLKTLGIDAGNFVGGLLGVPTAFLGFQAGMAGQGLSEGLSMLMNEWAGREWDEGTIVEFGKEIMKLLPEQGQQNVREFHGMGHEGGGFQDWFMKFSSGMIAAGPSPGLGNPEMAWLLEDWRKQSATAYEQNQAQITIKMLNNEYRTIWTGSIFDAQVHGNKDWERLEIDNGTEFPDIYMVKIERGVLHYINPLNWFD